jgi:DNA-binding NarL/FixJ family response regulator
MISIVVADDHRIVRQGIREMLSEDPNLRVVGEAATGEEALQLTDRLRPDVLVLDLVMPGRSGLQVLTELQRRGLGTKAVVLTMHNSRAFVREALQLGAAGYVTKDSSIEELAQAVRQAAGGQRFLSSTVSDALAGQLTQATNGRRQLSNREQQVLTMSAEGLTARQIGSALSIGRRTVEMHRYSAMRKLGLTNHAQLVRYAVEHGLLPPAREP